MGTLGEKSYVPAGAYRRLTEERMTIRRLSAVLCLALFGALGGVLACGDQRPCADCPEIGGTYDLTFSTPANAGGCDAGPPAGELTLGQQRAQVTATYEGLALSGTLYDTNDVTLSGQRREGDAGTVDDVRIKADFLEFGGADGGAAISGTWSRSTTRAAATGPMTCSQTASFSGPRR